MQDNVSRSGIQGMALQEGHASMQVIKNISEI